MALARFPAVASVTIGAVSLAVSSWLLRFYGQHSIERTEGRTDALDLIEAPEPLARKMQYPASAPLVAILPATAPSTPAGQRWRLEEVAALEKLRSLAASDPPQSLQLAREALQRFPQSSNAPEFAWNVVKALFNMDQLEEATAEARIMLRKYPGSYFANDVDHHLLNHPPNPPELR